VKLTFLLAVIVMTAAGIVVFLFRQDSVHCIANSNYIRNGETFSVITSHDMREGHGVIAITGRLTDHDNNVTRLGRDADLVVMVDCQIPADDLVVHFL